MHQSENTDIMVFPRPRKVTLTKGFYRIEGNLTGLLGNYSAGDPLPPGVRRAPGGFENIKREGYTLDIEPDGVTVAASDVQGVYYAVQTLKQLALHSDNGFLPCLHVEDWPAFRHRGVMWDISRDRVPSLETLYMMLDLFALLKLNQVQLYTEHTFAYQGHETVWKDASPYTQEDVRSILDYAARRGIEVIPNQNSLGHMERWLKHEEYKHLAETPEGFTDPWGVFRPEPSTLCPTDPSSLVFIRSLYAELLPLFPAGAVNVGGDEPWELGKGRSREACNTRGIDKVYLEYMLRLRASAAEFGKSMQMWGDIVLNHPEIIPKIPRDITIVEWGYEADHPFESHCRTLREAGLDFYVCPGTSSWHSLGGRWDNARENLESAALEGIRYGAKGYLIAEWGDNGHMQQLPVSFPAIVHGADLAWNGGPPAADEAKAETFIGRWLSRFVFGDAEGKLADALFAASSLPRLTGVKLHNASIFGIIIIDHLYPYYRKEYEAFRGRNFSEEKGILEEALRGLEKNSQSRSLFGKEIEFTLRFLLHAVSLAGQFFKTPSFSVKEIPVKEREILKGELEALLEGYRELWSLRSRPGGYADSVKRLFELKVLYEGTDP